MNRVKFVPADARARALGKPEVLVMAVTQKKKEFLHQPLFRGFKLARKPTVREAEILAGRRGWVRLSFLPESERRKYRGATAVIS